MGDYSDAFMSKGDASVQASTEAQNRATVLHRKLTLTINAMKTLGTVRKIARFLLEQSDAELVPDSYDELVSYSGNLPADSATKVSCEAGGVKKNGRVNKVFLGMICGMSLILPAIIFWNTSHDQVFDAPT